MFSDAVETKGIQTQNKK